jgi:AcrR family transcriptional regulator
METAKKSRKKSTQKNSKETILQAYQAHVSATGNQPESILSFCTANGISETDFYNEFGSFENIDKSCWQQFIALPIANLQADESAASFTAQEKLLTLYYALAETLKQQRGYALASMKMYKKPALVPAYLQRFKEVFEQFSTSIVREGIAAGEIATRPLADKIYPQFLWVHMGSFLFYWKEDSSAAFEKTDVFIEKSVNLFFELVSKGALDAAFDFGRFLYQSKSSK